jgi:hypothetical protein
MAAGDMLLFHNGADGVGPQHLDRSFLGRPLLALPPFAVLLIGGLLLGACVHATPRFPADVQRAINREDMRRLETSDLVVYYPEGTRAEALAVAARLEYCRRELARFELVKNGFATEKPVFVLPRMPLNNAYLYPTLAGNEQVSVVPQYNTSNLFLAYGIPPDPGSIGCHEMVHDQSYRQVTGTARVLRTLFGDVYSPQLGLDSWWQEGLAVYYETKLQGTGRLWTKYTDGLFAAGMQEVSWLHGGYLNSQKREVTSGAPYLIGARFVDYLARRYGEQTLWQVIAEQSDAWAVPFAISNEFGEVYEKSLATLIEEFEADTRRRYPARERPQEQHSLLRLGRSATLARAPSGREVIASEDLDEPPRLSVRDADGKTLSSHRLTDIGIGRRLIAPHVPAISGLSMTADGAHAYFVVLDPGPVFTEARLVHLDIEADVLGVVVPDLGGAGGSVSPDGKYYYFNRPIGKSLQLAFALFRLELANGRVEQLTTPEPRHYHADPVVSPDGQRLLVTEASDAGIRLAVYAAADGRRLGDVAAPEGIAFDGSWVDADRVVFAGSDPDRMQIFETDLRTQTLRRLTQAPYLAATPFSNGLTLRFLNRDGWNWTLDETYHPPALAPSPAPAPSPALAPAPALAPSLPTAQPRTSFAYTRRRPISDREPEELSDEPYSGFDGLFPPNAWAPWLSLDDEGDAAYGLRLMGGDRLGWQRWLLGAAWNQDARLPSASFSYLNSMLAPVSVRLDVAYSGRRDSVYDDLAVPGVTVVAAVGDSSTDVRLEEITGRLTFGTRLYDSLELELGGRYDHVRYEVYRPSVSDGELRFAGPLARIGFESAEFTPYAGKRLAVGVEATGSYFPEAFSSVSYDLVDARARTRLVFPLPLSRRHTLTLAGRWRALLGAPEGSNLLQVGGSGTDVVPTTGDESSIDDARAGVLPPGVRFFENLRGFEDIAQFTRRVLVGDATYTYPFIIDWGTASTLVVLPALFVRQLDLDLFFTAASFLEQGREAALATGASLELETSWWLVPLSFELQGTRRLSLDEEYAVYFVIGGAAM